MEYIDYRILKAGALCVIAFFAGLFGFLPNPDHKDQSQEEEPHDK